jgi:hypothetical protein
VGIIERQSARSGRVCEYRLTDAGCELEPLIEVLGTWEQRWVRSQFADEDLDPGLLMWDMRRCIQSDRFPPGRTVVRFEYRGMTSRKRTWCILSTHDDVDLCLKEPGFDVDLFVTTDLRTMTAVLMGAIAAQRAVTDGRIVLVGPANLRRRFSSWLGLSPFAHVEPGPMRRPGTGVLSRIWARPAMRPAVPRRPPTDVRDAP